MRKLILLLGLLVFNSLSWANPKNPTVTAGAANFASPDQKTLNISASDKAIISWDSFSIDPSESTFFELPDSSSAVLNRVTSSLPSTLAGCLQSNGAVYLINPNGILVTQEGVINTAAFLASTLDVSDELFLKGGDLLFYGDSQALVMTQGTITTWNGDLILLAYNIVNEGILEAKEGTVALGTGNKIFLSSESDQRIAVEISPDHFQEGIGIDNRGMIEALQAELKADGNLYALAIQHSGVINATTTSIKEGRIYLVAAEGVTEVNGLVNARGEDGPGGAVQVLGKSVFLNSLATIDVSGTTGGGSVFIGGGLQGRNREILNAEGVYMDPSAKVYAKALESGDGGTVIYWSDAFTYVEGSTYLTGGPLGGNGGFIEVSSRGFLDYAGYDDRSASFGKPGTLLLDPSTITISTSPNSNISFGSPCATNTFCGTATTASNIQISNGSTGLLDRLASGPVIVDSLAGTGTATDAAATITISNAITVAVNNPLTFNSSSGITINAAVTNSGTSNITFNSGTAATGAIAVAAELSNTSSGNIAVNSGTTATFTGSISFNSGASISNSGSGNITVTAGTVTSGSVTVGTSVAGVSVSNTGNGNITLQANGGSVTVMALSSIANNGTSGTVTISGSTSGTSVSISSPITASSSGAFQILAPTGNISLASTATLSFTGGAPVTIQGSVGTVTVAGTSNAFSGGAGPLLISADTNLTVSGPITNSYTGTSTITSVTGSITDSGAINNSGSGTLNVTSSNGTTTISATATNSGAGILNITAGTTASGTITFSAGAGLTNSGNGAINLNVGSATTTGTITTSTTSTITNSGTSGSISITGQGTSSGTALNIQGPITSSSTGAFSMHATQGAISTAGTTTMNFSVGAPVTIQTTGTGGSLTLAGTSMAFTGPNGSLTVSANNALAINGPITYSFSGAAQFSSALSTITTNASASMTFNSGAGNVSFSTPESNITTNASASIIFNSGAGNLTMTAGTNPTNAGTITNNSPLTFNSGAGHTVTMNSFGALTVGTINYGSTGLCQLTATGSSGSITTNSGTTLNWGSGGLSAGNLAMNAATAMTFNGGISFSATSGVSSPALSMTAGTNVTFNAAITYASPYNWTITNTNGTVSIGTASSISLSSGAGSLSVTANISSGTSISLSGPISTASTSAVSLIANTGNITSTAAAVFTSTNGAPVTIQTLGTSASITWASGSSGTPSSFSGGAGPLVMSAVGTLAINGVTNYSYTSPTTWTSTTGSITTNATGDFTANSGSGNVTFSAPEGSITTNSATLLLFNAGAGNFSMLAGTNPTFAGSITSSGTITMNSGAGKFLTLTAYGAISLSNVNDTSSGSSVFTAQNGAITTTSGTALTWGSGGGNLSMSATTNITTSGNIIFNALAGTSSPALSMAAPAITINGGGNIYSSPYNWTATASAGAFTTGSSSNILFNSGAGSFLVSATNLGGTTAINLSGIITSNSTSPLQFVAVNGDIISESTFALTASAGAPVTIQANAAANQTITLSGSMNMSGGTGPLEVLASSTISIPATLTYSDSMPAIFTTSGDSFTNTGTFTISGTGGLTISSLTDATISGNIIYTSTGNLQITSTSESIIVNNTIAMNTTATLFLNSALDTSILNRVTNSSTGPMMMTCGQDFLVGGEEVVVVSQLGSAGGDLTFTIGRDLALHAYGEEGNVTTTQIGYHTGNINSNILFNSIGRHVVVYAGWFPGCFAIIGHGSGLPGATGGTRNGNIMFGNALHPIGGSVYVAAYDMTSDFGVNSGSFAQIGHTRSFAGTPVTATGNIQMMNVVGNITVLGENSLGAYALIGHGGATSPQSDSFSGDVTVSSQGSITVQGGSFTDGFAGIGHIAVLNAPGTVTLQADLIDVVSTGEFVISTGAGAESFVGLYAKATAVGSSAVISSIAPMSVPQITVQSGANLTMTGAIPSDAFNGVLIGALAYTGAIPFVPAGNVGVNLAVTSSDAIFISSGLNGGSTNTFAYIINGIGSPMGSFDLSMTIGAGLSITGENNTAAINSVGTLEIVATGPFTALSNTGQSLISSVGNLTMSSSTITMNGSASAQTLIQTISGNLSLTSGLTQLVINSAISSGGTLTMPLSGDLFLSDLVTISSVGEYNISSTGKMTLAAGENVIITGTSTGSLTVTSDLFILSDALGSARVSAAGNLSVSTSTGQIYLVSVSGQIASIYSFSGSLTVAGYQGCTLLDGSDIAVLGGTAALSVTSNSGTILVDTGSNILNLGIGAVTISGADLEVNNGSTILCTGSATSLMTVNTTVGDLILGNGSSIQNLGAGGFSSSVTSNLNINANTLGSCFISAGSGGAVITANIVNLSGASALNNALISATGGGLSLTSGSNGGIHVKQNAAITLSNSGNYLLHAGLNLVVDGGLLENSGTGTTTVQGASVNLINGGLVQGNTGVLSISSTSGNIAVLGNSLVTSSGSISISGAGDCLIANSLITSTMSITTGTLSVVTLNNLNIHDISSIVAGQGTGTLTLAATNGNMTLSNDVTVQHLGTGAIDVTVGDAAIIRGGSSGDSFIAGNGTMTVNITGPFVIETASGGKGYLSSNGTTSVTSGNMIIAGSSSTLPAYIKNGTGNLTISSNSIALYDYGQIYITSGGSGTLSVTTTAGDLILSNGSYIQHQGSGALNSSVFATFLIEGGPLGAASILGNTGGGTISADIISLKGLTSIFNAVISAPGGTWNLSSTHSTNLASHAKIALTNSSGSDSLTMTVGQDLFVGNDSIIQNLGTNTPLTVTVTGAVNFLSGSGNATLQGNSGALALSAIDNIHFAADLTGGAIITSAGNINVSSMGDILFEGSSGSINGATISTSSGTVTVSSTNNLTMRDRASISITAGSGLLTANAGGDLNLENGANISGLGNLNSMIGGNLFIRGGPIGSSTLSCSGVLSLSVTNEITLEGVSGAQAMISSQGNTSISAVRLILSGFDVTSPGSITNGLGNLSVSADSIELLNFGQIKLTGGSGLLSVNTSIGDMRLANGSIISNTGSGAVNCNAAGTLYIEGGVLGRAAITSFGGATISADNILMTGFSSNNGAVISSSQGNLQVTSTFTTSLNPFATIVLSGGTGTLNMIVDTDLFVSNGSSIQSSSSGTTTIQVTGLALLLGGASDSFIKGNTGLLTFSVGDNLRIASDINGKAYIISSGPISVSAGGDITLLGAFESALPASIQTSSGALVVTAANNLVLYDTANISISGGAGTLTINTTSGDLFLENGSFLSNAGSGAINATIGENATIKAGFTGSSYISGNSTLSLSIAGDLTMETSANTVCYILCKGNSSVTAGSLFMNGFSSSFLSYIENTTGSLTINAGTIDLLNYATIKLDSGTSALTVNTTTASMRIDNGSTIQHLGTGPINSTVSGNLYILGETAASSIAGGKGGATISAANILMTGTSATLTGAITAAQGTLSVTTSGYLSLTPFSKINLLGGTNNLVVHVRSTLYEVSTSQIQNLGTGSTTITSGMTVICH